MNVLKAVPVISLCAMALMGCQSLRDAAGLQKKSPDEFAVTTKAPLVIPPDFNLRPPMPGAPPSNSRDPSTNAELALFNNADPQTVANGIVGSWPSPGERMSCSPMPRCKTAIPSFAPFSPERRSARRDPECRSQLHRPHLEHSPHPQHGKAGQCRCRNRQGFQGGVD